MTFAEYMIQHMQDKIEELEISCAEYGENFIQPTQEQIDFFSVLVRCISPLFPTVPQDRCGAIFLTEDGIVSLVFQPFDRRLNFSISRTGKSFIVLTVDEHNKAWRIEYNADQVDKCECFVHWVMS